jgi:predicted outer membrane protein
VIKGAFVFAMGGCPAADQRETVEDFADPTDVDELDIEDVEQLRATATVMGRLHRLDGVVIEFGEYAKAMAASGDVREYADLVVRDHERIEALVSNTGDRIGVEPRDPEETPSTRDPVDEETRRALVRAGGLEIDRRFLWIMVRVHQQAVEWLEMERRVVHPELKDTIDRIIPVLRQHEELSHRLLAEVPAA